MINKKKKIIGLVLASLAFIIILVGIYFIFQSNSDGLFKTKELAYQEFIVKKGHVGELKTYDKSLYLEGYEGDFDVAYYITGTLENNTGIDFDALKINFNLLDKDDKVLGIAVGYITDVAKDEEVKFKAMSLTTSEDAKKVESYKLLSVQKQ